MMKLTNNFYLQEFVPRDFYQENGDGSLKFIDQRIVLACQYLREKIGKPIIINNWHNDGEREFSGLRPFVCKVGVMYSQHKYGRAADLKCEGLSGEELRSVVKMYWGDLKKYITTMEADTETWLHIDCRWTANPDQLLIIPNPFDKTRSLEPFDGTTNCATDRDEYEGWD